MMSAEQCSDLDQETARIRAWGRVLRLQKEDHRKAAVQVNHGTAVFPQKGMYTPVLAKHSKHFSLEDSLDRRRSDAADLRADAKAVDG